MAAAVKFFVSVFLVLCIHDGYAVDVEWYISPTGSSNISTCGRTAAEPCSSLQLILNQSTVFPGNETAQCYLSTGATDGRDSTTLFFTGGVNSVPPICLFNWVNLRVVGLDGASITGRELVAGRGIFEFINCTNVTVQGLEYRISALARATLFFEACRDIFISNSIFPVVAKSSIGVQILQSAGSISLSGTRFYGDPIRAREIGQPNPVALDITHGCSTCTMPFSNDPYDFTDLQFSLNISNCTIEDIFDGTPAEDSYGSVYTSSVGLRLRLREGSSDNRVTVSDSVFRRIETSKANGVLVSLSDDISNNEVIFERCIFDQNRVRYGGGLSAYFYFGPSNNTLRIRDSLFTNTMADFEGGGVFAALLEGREGNRIFVSNSIFVRNSAPFGGAIFLLNNPTWFKNRGAFNPAPFPLARVELRDCQFEESKAEFTEGIVNALRVDLTVTGVSNFTRNNGSGLLLRVSELSLQGQVTFSGNTATTGGAINIREGSKVDMSWVSGGYFLDNHALFQGGAIYADSSSTSHLSSEYNHTFAQNIFGGCFLLFGNEPIFQGAQNPTRFTFRGNTAFADGQDIHSFSLRGCYTSNFLPSEVDRFLTIGSDGTILQEPPPNSNPFQSTSTGPSFLFFYGASTRCLKRVAGVTYLLPNCSHSLLTQTFYLHPNMNCGLLSMTTELTFIYGVPGTGLRPTVDRLVTPWAGIEASWELRAGTSRSQCPEPDPGNLMLSPAPGEQFDLTVQLADQLLNYVFNTIYLQVEVEQEGVAPGALLQFNGLQYGINDRIYFTPNRPISRIALVGAPGTVGRLKVVAASQVIGQDVVLLVPFQLANCHKGYFPSDVLQNVTRVQEMIAGVYSTTQRIPTDPFQPLGCHCFKETTRVQFSKRVESFNSLCIDGYTVQLSSSLWAGLIPEGKGEAEEFPPSIPCFPGNQRASIIDNLTSTVNSSSTNSSLANFAPEDVVPYMGLVGPGGGAPVMCFDMNVSDVVTFEPTAAVFSIELCSQGYCRGDARSSWVVANQSFPCAENRMGPLCGQCKPGFAVTLYSSTCRDCRDQVWQYYLSLALTLVCGLALVLLVIALNIGASPTMDSLLFFIQAVFLLLEGRSDYENFKFLAFFNPNFTFDLCIHPGLNNLEKLILQYATPLYILVLMFLVLSLTYFDKISRLLGRYSILKGLWLLFLISYFNIAMATYEILYCRRVGPRTEGGEGNRSLVLTHDASVRCYEGLHLPFAIIAWVLVAFFIIPLPVYLVVMMRVPKLKPLSDVYCSDYKDNRRWWIQISLLRRLLLVFVGVFIQDYVSRHFGLLVAVAFIVLTTMLLLPYKTRLDNAFVVFVTWMLLLTAIITQPDIYLSGDPNRGVSFFLVVFTIFFGLLLLVTDILLQRVKKRGVGAFYDETVVPWVKAAFIKLRLNLRANRNLQINSPQELVESTQSTASTFFPKAQTVDLTGYREPLLDSQFYGSDENADKFPSWKGNSGRSSATTSTLVNSYYTGSTTTGGIIGRGRGRGGGKGEEPDSTFPRKRFSTEEDLGAVSIAPTVTEVFTGKGDQDAESAGGEATVLTTRYTGHT